MSILKAAALLLVVLILSFVPTVFLRISAELITRHAVKLHLAYVLTLACYLPGIAIVNSASRFADGGLALWITSMIAAFVLLPGLVYGYFLKSMEGRRVGVVRGIAIAVVQWISMIVGVSAILLGVAFLIPHG